MKSPLKVAGWSGIIAIALSVATWIFLLSGGEQNSPIYVLGALVGGIFTILFLYGFVILGKKFKSQMLLVMSWIGIVMMIAFLFIGLIGNFIENASAQELGESRNTAIMILILVWVVFSLLFGAYTILFGIGLMKIGNKVEKARTAGILEIIAGATAIIFIGFLVKFVAYIFEIVLLMKASKKLEK